MTPEVGVTSYNIYRESDVAGIYDLIGNIPVDNQSIFVDESSNPEEQQYLYKISAMDTCGNESSLSNFHKTLFLQYSSGVGGITLGWKKYEIEDVTVDFVESLAGRGFKIDNPNKVPAHLKGTVAEKVQTIIDDKINPQIASHGGFVEVHDVQGTTVFLIMGGGCQGCSSAKATLRGGVEKALRQAVPEIGDIVDVTDHASGENPYYE